MSVWRENDELMNRLSSVQNHHYNRARDIMTFAAFMETKEELERYVVGHEEAVKGK